MNDSELNLLGELSKEVILLSRQSEFREFIFTESLKQKSGDYDVELSSLVENLKGKVELEVSLSKINDLSNEFETISNGVKLKIYYPRAQTFEKHLKSNANFNVKSQLDSPEIVIMNTYNEDYSSPAYQLNESDELVFTKNITEEYAAYNNVYIIGSEAIATNSVELILPDDPYGGGGGGYTPSYTYRTEGRAEDGGKIQVTDMNAIEHWTAGKFEFRVIVVSSTGLVIKDKEFDQRARDNFKDKRLYDFNEFYYNWYQGNIGAFTVEKWIEMDSGGDNIETTLSIPPAYKGGPTITVKRTSSSNDEDLGQTLIQYPDRVGQSYGLSHLNIQRQ